MHALVMPGSSWTFRPFESNAEKLALQQKGDFRTGSRRHSTKAIVHPLWKTRATSVGDTPSEHRQ
jgi:hypothetical protein